MNTMTFFNKFTWQAGRHKHEQDVAARRAASIEHEEKAARKKAAALEKRMAAAANAHLKIVSLKYLQESSAASPSPKTISTGRSSAASSFED